MSLYGDFITIDDLYLAYRKSKQEAFLDTFYENSIKYAEFEEQLHTNIERLYDNLTSVDSSWHLDVDFIGGYLYIPKKINDDEWNKKNSRTLSIS